MTAPITLDEIKKLHEKMQRKNGDFTDREMWILQTALAVWYVELGGDYLDL